MNPYQSPIEVDFHTWSMAPWLKRFLIAVAVIVAFMVFYDSLYIHRLQSDPNSRFAGARVDEIFETWVQDELHPGEGKGPR